MTLKKLNSNSNSLTLKKLNSNSNSLTLQKSNSKSNSSITCERIQIQIQNLNSIHPPFYTKDSKRILLFAPSKSQSRCRRCVLAHRSQGLREGGSGGTPYPGPGLGGAGLKGPGRVQVSACYVLVWYHNTVIKLAYSKNIGQPLQYW